MTDVDRREFVQKAVDCLNTAFHSDPAAMHALIANRVPCNDKMTNHPHIICDPIRVLQDERSMVGTLGLLNGVLAAMGLPAVCSIVRDDPRQTLQGFDLYRPKGAE